MNAPRERLRRRWLAAAVLSFLAVSWLDYATGDIGVTVFYLAPIYFAAWGGSRAAGVAAAAASAAVIFALDFIAMHANRFVLWDDVMKLAFLVSIALLQSRLKEAHQEERATRDKLDSLVRSRTAQLALAANELQAFNYALAHHLRAPLRGISGFSRRLQRELDDGLDAAQRDGFERIRAAAAKLDALIDGLVAVTSLPIAEASRRSVDLSALARRVVEELRKGEPGRRVLVRIEHGVRADCDPRLLRSALGCLLGNAWKFTSRREGAEIFFGSRRERGETVYFVRDNGAGFDMAYAARLFQPFQRLHSPEEYPGMGIGLAMFHQIISRHGGRAWAEGEVDRGAAVYFTLEPKGRISA